MATSSGLLNIDAERLRLAQIRQNLDIKKAELQTKLKARGDVLANLLPGYVRNVQVIVDVSELLQKYNDFAAELVAQLDGVDKALNVNVDSTDINDLRAKTVQTLNELRDRYTKSIEKLQTLIPNLGSPNPVDSYSNVQNSLSGGNKKASVGIRRQRKSG